jgi:hypothetical protein
MRQAAALGEQSVNSVLFVYLETWSVCIIVAPDKQNQPTADLA